MIAPASARIARVSKYRWDRAKARLPSVRAAIRRHRVTINSPNGALNSSLSGDFSSSSCTPCGEWVAAAAARVVEEVPWGDGKRTLTKVYMLFLAAGRAAFRGKKLLRSFRTSWEHRTLGQIDAIGGDEIQY